MGNLIDPFDDGSADDSYLNAIAPSQSADAGPSETNDHASIASYDVICLGDTFYEESLAIDALLFVETAHAAGARVLVGDPSRSYFPRDRFRLISEYAVPVTRELEDSEIKKTAVWTFRR